MILYCDTSALLKLYVRERHSDVVKALANQAESVAVCRIAWAEAFAALARHSREFPDSSASAEAAKRAIAADWPRLVVLEVTQPIVERAGDYADAFGLRGYDSVQLAAARQTALEADEPAQFACFDTRLNRAARLLGLGTPCIDLV